MKPNERRAYQHDGMDYLRDNTVQIWAAQYLEKLSVLNTAHNF
jgi:hypothetical protein